MTYRILLPLLLAAACSPAGDVLPDDRNVVADEIRAANVALLDALNAHDIPGVLAFYETDPQFRYVGCTNVIHTSAVFGSIIAGYHRSHPDVTYDMTIIGIEVLDRDGGIATLEGESDSLKLLTTRVWRRGADNAWRVAYEHESWPGCKAPALPHPGTAVGDTATLESLPSRD